ncbi:bifunctional riboflavin kinase/FAD synthetase [Fuchsiella alkaliacetigena]|uniref:bifunctional riboflavin kinase/FAD synthetase n=1 Tax=Fuchsiella alkaliacetigena TaxID=957042 RepID=UPI00200AC354|nr:bifunctional riboflavin kinase/FAD synthetase [Fuchsiella alkaliacetigena]MCK8823500.1 bifunctional riboflavin kinase/FAD synthetase [Fuchsiella alkaliacetigena]
MEVVRGEAIKEEEDSVVVTLGCFDGIHYGHQQIIEETITNAKQLACKSALFSFTPHPMSVIAPQKKPRLLSNWQQKLKIIAEIGIDKVYLQEFTNDFAKLDFESFVKDYLVAGINAQKVVVGSDFQFGHRGLGNVDKLKKSGKELGFTVQALEAVTIEGVIVSSTYIRELIESGQVSEVKKYLSRNYSILGEVVGGDKRGRKLGFPTANLKLLAEYVIPKIGVYAVKVSLNGSSYQGVAHLGAKPTFSQNEFTFEVHIFDFGDYIYQQQLEVEFVQRLRGQIGFASQEELVKQINQDIEEAREILNK